MQQISQRNFQPTIDETSQQSSQPLTPIETPQISGHRQAKVLPPELLSRMYRDKVSETSSDHRFD